MIPLPVIASVAMASTKPIMAARPLSCSENEVKPCGMGSLSAAMTIAGRRAGVADDGRREMKDVVAGAAVLRARTGVTVTKAVVFILVELVGCLVDGCCGVLEDGYDELCDE